MQLGTMSSDLQAKATNYSSLRCSTESKADDGTLEMRETNYMQTSPRDHLIQTTYRSPKL